MRPRDRARVVLLLGLVATTSVAVWAAAQTAERTVKIGLLTLSDPSTPLPAALRNAAQLAVDEEAEALRPLGIKVELLVHDDWAAPWVPGQVAQEGIPFMVVGFPRPPQLYQLAHGVAPTNTAIVTLATERAVTDQRLPSTVFRVCGRTGLEGAVVADYAKSEGIGQLYIFYDDPSYTDRMHARVIAGDMGRAVAQRQLRVRASTAPPPANEPGATVLVTAPWKEGDLLRRAREGGFKGTVLFVRHVGPAIAYPRGRGFITRYRTRYGEEPLPYAANAYDAVVVGLRGLQHVIREQGVGGSPSLDVTGALRRIRYAGVTGDIEFDERGDLRNPTFMVYEFRGRRVFVHGRCATGACPCRTGGCANSCCRRTELPVRRGEDREPQHWENGPTAPTNIDGPSQGPEASGMRREGGVGLPAG
jgi:ABC-type branched-subunit amino acid transport system substrate-binding protein